VDRALAATEAELRLAGRRVYPVPRGGATAVGALGYAQAAAELCRQIAQAGLRRPVVVVATGSGGTQAGLVAGCAGLGLRIVGASVSRPAPEARTRVAALADACAVLLGRPPPGAGPVEVADVRGPGYGVPSEAGAAAARLAAETEGLLLDHVFTAKALGLAASMFRSKEDDVVFVHTGGIATRLAALVGWTGAQPPPSGPSAGPAPGRVEVSRGGA
jgi:D-cysteine desulfhydrase